MVNVFQDSIDVLVGNVALLILGGDDWLWNFNVWFFIIFSDSQVFIITIIGQSLETVENFQEIL